jgi:hypothetical protein
MLKQVHASTATSKASEPLPLMIQHWNYCKAHNRPVLPIAAIQHQAHSTQPTGFVQGWSTNKAQVKHWLAEYLKEYPKAQVRLVVFKPPSRD